MSIPQDFPAIQRFEKLGGTDWETLKSTYVMTIRPGEEAQLQATQQMQEHIKDRDIVDYASYREAILRIFPATYFNLSAEITGDLAKTSQGRYAFTATWYHFIVEQKTLQLPTGLDKSAKCTIAIKAPGSRKLTSDIDTSIQTTFKGECSFFERAEARIKTKGPDFEGRISNAVIEGFYTISEELFKMTSSSQRDSNAYIDTLANDQESYPKFLHDEENNPSIHGERLFSEEEFTKIFKKYKHQKHVQEMAASLFSLRCSLEEEEWQKFKLLAKEQLREIPEAEFSALPKQERETHISSCQQDYDAIFQKVEEIHGNHLAKLAAKIQGITVSEFSIPVRKQDIPVAALNRLYVEYLEECATCRGQILTLKSKKQALINQLDAEKTKLSKELVALKRLGENSDDEEIQALIERKQKNCALLEKSCNNLKDTLRQNIQEIARLQVDYQFYQILANTFANEAYVCRSAVYHVVKGQSGVKDLAISQQTLLGSALQQVGFKLLHTKELTHKEYSPEAVAYYTAKYGQRIFNLVFSGHHAEFTNEIIKALAKGRKGKHLPKFTYLKSKQVRQNAYSTLEQEELALLNHQAQIIHCIKSDNAILDAKKPEKTLELIQKLYPFSNEDEKKRYFENEKKLYLSLSAKLIGLVCVSRLDKKGYLWGQNPSIPLRYLAAEKKEGEDLPPAISHPEPLQNSNFPASSSGGIAKDEHHKLDKDATNLVMASQGGKAEVSYMEGGAGSQSAVVAGASEEASRNLTEGFFKKKPK
ncbi:hypothetical protein [Parachlamydia sp. AcF125]|uniref:hypothetical protein n=1 Tax=Parachlamydia sp. AcF125 TaxID=2795736 RepID=UPI001BC94E3A|nr:hypothetical protein [Parachlamydia sp. AcF125]MBS4169139.1 hypothetical protein [Parachlamydia sp. AcF125]